MTSSVLLLLAIVGVVLLWLDGARARELATAVAEELCRRRGYQLLDGTVALGRMGLAGSAGGLRLRRMFRFDYSVEGAGRQSGVVIMRGSDVETAELAEPPPAEPTSESIRQASDGDNVVPFKRRH